MIIAKEKFDELRRVGQLLSNVAYNLSQHTATLSPAEKSKLAELVRKWDAVDRSAAPVARLARR